MKKLLYLVILFSALPSFGAWTCAQGAAGCTVTTARTCSGSTASCNITVTATHAHAVEVMCGQHGTSTASLNASASDGTWTVATASRATNATAGMVECAYNLNATGGVTTINCPFSATGNIACEFFEFTGTLSTFTFDTANSISDTTCTSCASPTLTLATANNYILIASSSCGGTCSAINQSYTAVFITGDGGAFKINQAAFGTAPSWTMTSGVMVGSAIAIYEVAGGAPTVFGIDKKQKLEKFWPQ